MVALVILALFNLILSGYILYKISIVESIIYDKWSSLDYKIEDIKQRNNMQNEGIIMSFNKWYEQLRKIPKEIVVKNVLNIP